MIFFCGCAEEHSCNSFNLEHPLLQISLSPTLSDTLIFESQNGTQVKLGLKQTISDPYEEKCSGFTENMCKCLSEIEQIYLGSQPGFFCGVRIEEREDFDGLSSSSVYSFFSEKVFFDTGNLNSNNDSLDSFISSIIHDSILYEDNYYYNILEFYNAAGSYYISKFWIKKDIGLYKFWRDNQCWSLKEDFK